MKGILIPSSIDGVWGEQYLINLKREIPSLYNKYKENCFNKRFSKGMVQLFNQDDKFYIIIASKDTWRDEHDTNFIKDGINKILKEKKEIKELSFPKEYEQYNEILKSLTK